MNVSRRLSGLPQRLLAAVLLSLSLCAFADRDPFSPPGEALCAPMPPPQLRGIIGRENDYRAWLIVSGVGRLWARQSWPDQHWRLQDTTVLGITLIPTACGSPLRINLQGKLYEARENLENAAPAGMADRAAARLSDANLSGFR